MASYQSYYEFCGNAIENLLIFWVFKWYFVEFTEKWKFMDFWEQKTLNYMFFLFQSFILWYTL